MSRSRSQVVQVGFALGPGRLTNQFLLFTHHHPGQIDDSAFGVGSHRFEYGP